MKRLLPIFALLFLSLFALSACRSPLTPAESQSSSESEKTGTEIDDFATLQNGVVIVLAEDRSSYTVTGYTGTDTTVVIPAEYKGVKITEIYYSAFLYSDSAKSLTSVTIGDSVESIGDYAFQDCTSLTSVTFPDSVTSIGRDAFRGCTSLTDVTIPDSVTSIGESAFFGCTSLTSVTIGNSVTSIGSSAFYECTSLASVTIPDSVTSIGSSAFSYCSGLTSVTIGNSVMSIGGWAFYSCKNLTSVTIPNSVTSIDNGAFNNCTSLVCNEYDNAYYLGNSTNPYLVLIKAKNKNITSCMVHEHTKFISDHAFGDAAYGSCKSLKKVTIPDSVTVIGNQAFYNCTSLTSVYYHGTEASWGEVSIGDNNSDLTDATRYYYSEEAPTDAGNFWHYDNYGNIVVW